MSRDPQEDGDTQKADEKSRRTPTPSGGRPGPRRFPGWVLVPLGGLAGWVVSGWLGAALGAAIGAVLWRSRA